jgi:hypothetical protein
MRKIIFLIVVLFVGIISCKESNQDSSDYTGDIEFQKLSDDFIKGYLAWRPQTAVYLGLHEFDGLTTNISKESIEDELVRLKRYDQKLSLFDISTLSPEMYYDFRILHNGIRKEIFDFEGMEYFRVNPMVYAGGLDVSIYINRDFAPLEDRLRSIIDIESEAKNIYTQAKLNLADSLAEPFIKTAILMTNGFVDFLQGDLILALKDVKNDSLMAEFEVANRNAILELKEYASFLENEKLPKAHNKFALGEEKYKKMLLYQEGISLSPKEILAIGLEELEKEKEVFTSMAQIIDSSKTPVEVYQGLKREHPSSEQLIPSVAESLEGIRKFLIEKRIVTIPSKELAQVKETPKYARSLGMASMNPPGPFEKVATEAYFYITPPEESWTEKQREEWLTMFETYSTDVISIHEVYPGHYVQFLHLNASSASDIQKIFGSYAFAEGWAHYCEKMMIDEGFGDTGDPIKAAKYRMAQSGGSLVRLCRLCVSVNMHCKGMSVDEATKFFMENWFQGEQPSRQEATRGTYDPGYLYYSLGKLQMIKLREDYYRQEGDIFSLHEFHDLVLNQGMPSFRLLREKVLNDEKIWDEIL